MAAARLARIVSALVALASAGALAAPSAAAADPPPPPPLLLFADVDDDDANGVPDGEEEHPSELSLTDAVPLDASAEGATLRPNGSGAVRIVAGTRVVPWGTKLPAHARVQAQKPGLMQLSGTDKKGRPFVLALDVRAAFAVDLRGKSVDFTRSHLSLARTPPSRLGSDAQRADTDEVDVVLGVPDGSMGPLELDIESYGASGVKLDALGHVALAPVACPGAPAGLHCLGTPAVRLVVDDVDRSHPLVAGRALRAEVGGAIAVRSGGRKQALRGAGPRETTVGPIGRFRVKLRPFILRLVPGGAPAIGGTDPGAIASLRAELALTSATWGQCGISFGDVSRLDITLVDPPTSYVLAIGNDLGLPASGGSVTVKVEGKPVTVPIPARAGTDDVARLVALAITKAGFAVTISPNVRIAPGVFPSVDLLVKKKDGHWATVEAPVSTDRTMAIRLGAVDLVDGLEHFGDMDSMSGTLEERTLVKSIEDGDPTTVEVVVVPFFGGSGRIGESFISSESPSMRNVVLLDRAGVRARRSSFTVAHEAGHVLLDAPGHPDDYDVDTPTLLMDSDASDSSPFGPRRISVDECARVIRESGPTARLPLLTPWPLAPLALK